MYELPSRSVVVGVDGSRSAVQAALWAVDEAVSRDIPLRLVYAIDAAGTDPDDAAGELASAETAIRQALTAVESTGKPVKTEADIMARWPPRSVPEALLEAARSAAMLCVGSAGLRHAAQGRIGITAATKSASAHSLVAVIPQRIAPPARSKPGVVLAVVDEPPDSDTVLEQGLREVQLRGAPLRVLILGLASPTDVSGPGRRAEENRRAHARLDRILTRWRRNHPDLDVASALTHGGLLRYLQKTDRSIQLVVVGPRRAGPADALFGPSGRATLDYLGCTALICQRQFWL
jgi:nucleotide-binding universal stress UspA family protein